MGSVQEIRLAHGGGGRYTQQLIENVFLPAFANPQLALLNDSAILDLPVSRIALTTDSYTVDPLFFPGGDIGRLAVCGTVNDLSVAGARPLFLSAGFILEEGFPLADLTRIVESARNAAAEAGVSIVTGDTKVIPHGKADKCFINTSGVGVVERDPPLPSRVREGDTLVINGFIGCHGMAVMTSRKELGFASRIESDVAPLNHLTARMMKAAPGLHAMRDATRGGVAAVLNEMASQASLGIELTEEWLPVTEAVNGACEILGLDPLYIANEGVVVASVSADETEALLKAMKEDPRGRDSRVIGRVCREHPGRVVMQTRIGSHRIVDMLSGEQLPRIC